MGSYKLIIRFIEKRLELYNLENDIGERLDLSEKLPDKTRELHDKYKMWLKAVGAPVMRPNPQYRLDEKD